MYPDRNKKTALFSASKGSSAEDGPEQPKLSTAYYDLEYGKPQESR
jgi:hypothetical protein